MSQYQLGLTDSYVIRTSDSAIVPNSADNQDWLDYQSWLSKGNAPDEAQPLETALERIAAKRFSQETAGTTSNGYAVYTDRTTQMKLTGVALRAYQDSTYSVDWKLTDGTFATLDATQITAVANSVADYVQACYAREAVLVAAVAAGTYTDSMLTEGWPT